MRIGMFLALFLISLLGIGQDLNEKLEKITFAVDEFYKTSQPYSMVINLNSANYHNGKSVSKTNQNKQYKMVMGEDFDYMYLNTSQVFKDSLGELKIDNQKRIIEFNSFRKRVTFGPGETISHVANEVGVSIKSIKQEGNKIILFFTNQSQDVEVEYVLVNNRIVSSTHKNFGNKKVLVYTLKTTFTDFKPKLTQCNKYKKIGHGRLENGDFIPNSKYNDYEIFNY